METDRTSDVLIVSRPAWRGKLSSARGSVSKVRNHLRSHPAKWTGAAVGAGFGVGLLGRLILHRAENRAMPEVIVISAV